jgi:hypothetical protein
MQNIGGRGGICGTSEVADAEHQRWQTMMATEGTEMMAAKAVAATTERQRQRDASKTAACIGGIEIHQKSTEADRADRAGSEYKVSEAVKAVRTC